MRDADIDLARLQARKDGILARFAVRSHAWQGLQGAALAALGFGVVGPIQGIITPSQALAVAGFAGAVLLLAVGLAMRQERRLSSELKANDEAMERLKRGGAP